jgi:malonyl-CoA/methylmalonyl-CoA synthetase
MLLETSRRRAVALLGREGDLCEARVGYLQMPSFDQVATQWAIWRAGGVAVPLAPSHPAPELAQIIADARPAALLVAPELHERAAEALEEAATLARVDGGASFAPDALRVLTPAELEDSGDAPAAATLGSEALPSIDGTRRALIVYTSGTTGRPKGAVSTHANLAAQIGTLVEAWEWSADDRILHVLPLHHVHGIVNALCCALWVGACCEFCEPEPRRMWERLASGEITVFMAVPTIYRRLIDAWEAAPQDEQQRWSAGSAGLRLMVSGSAALPVETLERWQQITGHRLLERYGMTEIGMALGNPLHGERRAGTVGQPFAGVEARIVDDNGAEVGAGEAGQIEVRGPQVFREYWDRPAETRAAFTADGWFRTGDDGVVEDGYWRILGRRSVDIIKSGGYKVSALEIEAALRQHPAVADAAVIGLPDEEWGERVCAAVVPEAGQEIDGEALRAWCKERLAPYKVPKQVAMMTHLPRNAMGKVTKPALRPLFTEPAQ